jgi:hypothetical protein
MRGCAPRTPRQGTALHVREDGKDAAAAAC